MLDSLRLVTTLAEWERVDALADQAVWGHADLAALDRRGDRLYDRLTWLAIRCGFSPSQEDSRLSVRDFAHRHAASVRRTVPRNVREITQDNQPTTGAA